MFYESFKMFKMFASEFGTRSMHRRMRACADEFLDMVTECVADEFLDMVTECVAYSLY